MTSYLKTMGKEKKVEFNIHNLSNRNLYLFTGLLTIVYFIFSTFSDGFYMHDEPMFFIYAKNLWNFPKEEIWRFQKLGYVLFISIPVLFGPAFLAFFNSLVSALTVMFSYKVLKKLGSKNSFLIFFLLGLQPLWFMLAFRTFSEFLVALLTVLVIWNHINKKYLFAALILSYAAFSRQEYHVFVALYGLLLLFKKQWVPALLTGTFTVLHNLMGYIVFDDILYLFNRVTSYSERMTGTFPSKPFSHYFTMSNIIFGSVTLVLFMSYIGGRILKKKNLNWFFIIPILVIFFFNVYGAITIGGGNLRYMMPIAPLIAMLCVFAIDDFLELEKKQRLLIFLIPIIALIGLYQTYNHDFMKLFDGASDGIPFERNWLPLYVALVLGVLIIIPLKRKQYFLSIALLTIVVAVSSVRTFPLNPEDATMKKAGKWFAKTIDQGKKLGDKAIIKEDARIATSHILLYYFSEKLKADFKNPPIHNFVGKQVENFKSGDIVVWDTHYGYRPKLRPGSVPYDTFDKSPEYEKIQYFQSKDRRFMIVFFRKK